MAIDIALTPDASTGVYDISFVDGDFKTLNSFDTSIIVSLFSDKRASVSEVPISENRRGWWGNQFTKDYPLYEIGSKLWLLEQSRRTQSVLNSAIDFANNSLQWLVDDNHAEKIEVTGAFVTEGIRLTIVIYRGSSVVETRYYDLWENSGQI